MVSCPASFLPAFLPDKATAGIRFGLHVKPALRLQAIHPIASLKSAGGPGGEGRGEGAALKRSSDLAVVEDEVT